MMRHLSYYYKEILIFYIMSVLKNKEKNQVIQYTIVVLKFYCMVNTTQISIICICTYVYVF